MLRYGEAEQRAGERVTWIGVGTNLGLVVCKLVAAVVGRSQALVADAVHSVSDLLTDGIVLVGLRLGRKAPDADHHFGHARIETLASTLVGLALLVAGVVLGYDAGAAVHAHESTRPNVVALLGAALSIVVKEVLYQITAREGRRIGSQAVLANAWHHRSDALSSVAVLIGVGAALVNPDWHILDAFAALLVAFLVAGVGLRVIWATLREMVDTAPDVETVTRIRSCLEETPGIDGVHDLKIRVVGGRYHVQAHVHVDGDVSVWEGHRTARRASAYLAAGVEAVADVIIHVDPSLWTGEDDAEGDG